MTKNKIVDSPFGVKKKLKIGFKKPDGHNPELAREILRQMFTIGISIGKDADDIQKLANKIISSNAKKHGGVWDGEELLLLCRDFVVPIQNPSDKLLLAQIYEACPVKYTLYAIRAYEDYMSGDLEFEPEKLDPRIKTCIETGGLGVSKILPFLPLPIKDQENQFIAGLYSSLASLYEVAHDYNKAYELYKKELEFDNLTHFPYIHLSEICRKLNRLDEGIAYLEEARRHPKYEKDERDMFMSEVIENFLKELEEKKARGYVFRPRRNKEPFLEPDF